MYFTTFILKNLVRRPVRSLLTALGIAVSVGAMVALLSIAHRFTEATAESFEVRGADLVILAGGAADQLSSDVDASLADPIRAIPGVKVVAAALVTLNEVQKTPDGSSFTTMIQGWPPENPSYNELRIEDGRKFEPGDRKAALLGVTTASNLKKHVGDTVYIQREAFTVVGIYRSFVVYENGSIVVPLDDLQDLMARKGRVTGFSIVADPTPDLPARLEQIRAAVEGMTDAKGRRLGLTAMPTRDYVNSSLHLRLAHAMAWMVSTVTVIIGTIGTLNTMVMSVLERVREIGILRAVGWPRRRVIRMVLAESMFLTLVGSLVGVAGAVLLTSLLVLVPTVNGFIDGKPSPVAIAQGLGIALLIGLVGGAYPAYRAARLSPTEALHHD